LYLATKKGAPGVGSKAKNNGSNNKHSQRLAGQVQADRNERPKGFRRAKGQKSQWKVKEAKKARPKRSWPEKTLFAHGKKWYNEY